MSEEITNPPSQTRQRPKGRRKPRDGEIGIRYGNRNYIKTPGQMLIAKKGKWHLVALPSMNREGWWNFKLYLHERKVFKNLWSLGMHKSSLVRNRDFGLLNDYYSEIVPWVLEQAKLYAEGKLVHRKEQGKEIIYREGKGWSLRKGKSNG